MGAEGGTEQYNTPTIVQVLESYRGSGDLSGAFVEQSWSWWEGRVRVGAGGRWDRHSLDKDSRFSPQASLALRPFSSLRFELGWGNYVQYPEVAQFTSTLGSPTLRPMRSTHAVGAVEQRFGDRTRLRAEFYDREDRDLINQPFLDPRILNGRVFVPPVNPLYENSLNGHARGVEVFFQKSTANGLTGWISYAYGRTWMHDDMSGASYPSDWDQRHTVNVYGSYRIRPTVNLSLRCTYGSGFPVPAFVQRTATGYALAAQRNQLRLPSYFRSDVRVNKAWTTRHWKTTLYGEVLNITNRTNYRFDSFDGYYPQNGIAYVSLDQMFPILPSVGVVFER